MSWMHKLYETYENCRSMVGKIEDDDKMPLLPICHTTQKAHIEIVIDGKGDFKRAGVIPKNQSRTIIPCTEDSGGRTSGGRAHPLCDKLQYVASDYKRYGGGKKSYFDLYHNELREWCESKNGHMKAKAVLTYVQKASIITDLIKHKVLYADKKNKLINEWTKSNAASPEIFQLLSDQSEAFIRWIVEVPGDTSSKVWKDKTVWDSWIKYYSSTKKKKNICYVTGKDALIADQHPYKLRNDGDKAKLISSNDWDGFTFRGRFTDTKKENNYQACAVGFEVTQKAHSALRWLISRQGYRNGDQAIVAWATSGADLPDPFADPLGIVGEKELLNDESALPSTAQELARKLKAKIAGYTTKLGNTTGVVVMGIDSATTGRMAITFYRELSGSDFLERIARWHESCAWLHDYRFVEKRQGNKMQWENIRFVGAPVPKDIALIAYGNKDESGKLRIDEKLLKATIERILPCIIDGRQIPRDIVDSAIRRASNRMGLKYWEWKKALTIACALYRKYNEKEVYEMTLDETRRTRDYLFGRLLAIAEHTENRALYVAGEKRDTTAAKMMQRFSDRPFSTWEIIEEALAPYKTRLRVKRPGFLHEMNKLLDEIHALFSVDDYESDRKLSGEYLLGYHCQRNKLMQGGTNEANESEVEPVENN